MHFQTLYRRALSYHTIALADARLGQRNLQRSRFACISSRFRSLVEEHLAKELHWPHGRHGALSQRHSLMIAVAKLDRPH